MFLQKHLTGPANSDVLTTGLGATLNGTPQTVGAFDEQGLVRLPESLSSLEAATLSCAGVTAWNVLLGMAERWLLVGQRGLTQGISEVSTLAVQSAKAVGVRVIATTSTSEKAELLRKLGADHVLNYRVTPHWGTKAKELTWGVGMDVIVEVPGSTSLKQSVDIGKLEGIISVVAIVGRGEAKGPMPTLLDCWMNLSTARGLWVGSRVYMEETCSAIEGNVDRLRPVVDTWRLQVGKA